MFMLKLPSYYRHVKLVKTWKKTGLVCNFENKTSQIWIKHIHKVSVDLYTSTCSEVSQNV